MRITKEQLVRERDAASEQATLLSMVLNSILNGDGGDATERAKGDQAGTSYTFRLYRATGAHGGIVAVTFRAPGQQWHTSVYYFDTFDRQRRESVRYGSVGWTPEMHSAMDRLGLVRDRLNRDAAA